MALVSKDVVRKVVDRAAFQYKTIVDAFHDAFEVGSGSYYEIITETNDPDVELSCGGGYRMVDLSSDIKRLVCSGTNLCGVIKPMNEHFNIVSDDGERLQLGGWDGYLSAKDLRVSQYFAELYFNCTGKYLLSKNVFSEGIDEFGSFVINDDGVSFVDGVSYGSGDDFNPANGKNFAPTQLKIVVDSIGVSGVDVRLSVKDSNNNLKMVDVQIPSSAGVGEEFIVGEDRYLDVTFVSLVSGGLSGGVGDSFRILNLKERIILL